MVKDAYGTVIDKKVYDCNGNVIKEIDAKGYASGATDDTRYGTLFTYDLANRLVKVVDPETAALNDSSKWKVKYEYNQFGEKTKETDGLGNATQYQYGVDGNLVKVVDPLNTATQYAYNKAGSKVSMTDGRGKVTTYTYGSTGILLSMTDPESKVISYTYDLDLNRVDQVDRNGNDTVFSYNARKLLLSRKVATTGESVSYSYDEAGNRAGMVDDSGINSYTYDADNRLTVHQKDRINQVSYSYDDAGNVLAVTDKTGFVTTYTYDKNNRMKTVGFVAAGTTRTTAYTYDANGNRASIVYDGGTKETYTYDRDSRLTALSNQRADGSVISSYGYTYDLAGRQISKTDSYGTTAYTYDAAGRITRVATPGKTTLYAYDAAGNRLSLNETYVSQQFSGYVDDTGSTGANVNYLSKASQYVYSNANRLLQLVEKMYDGSNNEVLQKRTDFCYDANGNQTGSTVAYLKNYDATKGESFSMQATNDGQKKDAEAPLQFKTPSTGDTESFSASSDIGGSPSFRVKVEKNGVQDLSFVELGRNKPSSQQEDKSCQVSIP